MEDFVKPCFDPKSPMNTKLKQTLIKMLGKVTKGKPPSIPDISRTTNAKSIEGQIRKCTKYANRKDTTVYSIVEDFNSRGRKTRKEHLHLDCVFKICRVEIPLCDHSTGSFSKISFFISMCNTLLTNLD